MHVWNPQLEHHLDIVDENDDDASTGSAASDEHATVNDDCSLSKETKDSCCTDSVKEKRVFSQNQLEYVGVGLLLASWYLGGGAPVSLMNGVMLLVAFGTWIASRRQQRGLHMIQHGDEEYLKCRLKLSAFLGSIGAPPLQQESQRTEMGNEFPSNDYCDLVLNFCQAHVDLIHQVDHSLEMLKTATSMSLRSSTTSAERVELANMSRKRTQSTVSLSTARKMLSRVMIKQYQSLECLMVGKNEVKNESEVPNVVTLAWLRLLRTELASLLSVQVSHLISSPKAFHDATCSLNESICTAKESSEYLASIFTLKQPPQQCQAEMDSSDLNLLYRQFEMVSVALWACQVSDTDESANDSTKPADAEVVEFLQHFETLLCSVNDVKERLLNQWKSLQNGPSDRLTTTEEDTMDGINLNHTDDVKDYEDSGALSLEDTAPSKCLEDSFGNKTVVFVCSGRDTLQNQDKDHNESNVNVANQQRISSQGMMLQELQHRLTKLEQAEEVDAKGNAIDTNEEATERSIARQEESRISTRSLCLEVSGDVLSELKRTLDLQNDSAEVMIC